MLLAVPGNWEEGKKAMEGPGTVAYACNPSTLVADHLGLGVGDQPGQHGVTPSLLKIQQLARCDGAHL